MMYKSIGYKRLELGVQLAEWGLPFHYHHGIGGLTFGFLCFQAIWWRNDMRYERYDD